MYLEELPSSSPPFPAVIRPFPFISLFTGTAHFESGTATHRRDILEVGGGEEGDDAARISTSEVSIHTSFFLKTGLGTWVQVHHQCCHQFEI